jgi:hypothetical protein
MGFEEDYVEKLRDPDWGPAAAAFAKGQPDATVATLLNRAAYAEARKLRSAGDLRTIRAVAEAYRGHAERTSCSDLFGVTISEADRQRSFSGLRSVCEMATDAASGAGPTRAFATMALCRAQAVSDARIAHTIKPADGAASLVGDLFRDRAEANLQPAAVVAGNKRRESPAAVAERMQRVLDMAAFTRLGADVLAPRGSSLRAPRIHRASVAELATARLDVVN